jgi:GT2 family glycosyltransferase
MLPIAAIVISYRRPPMVLSCLGKLLALPDAPSRVWLVDNAPEDGTAALVREKFPMVQIIGSGENLGFAAGNNMGMNAALAAGFPFILLLNDDAELEPGVLTRLYETINSAPAIGAVGPIVCYGDGRMIWSAGGRIGVRSGLVGHVLYSHFASQTYTVDYVTACAVLYRSDAIKQVGMFDERFFMYYEDSDLGVRLSKAGYHNVIDTQAKAIHHVPRDLAVRMHSPGFLYYLNRNRILFMRKHNPWGTITAALVFRSLLELFIVFAKGNAAGFYAGLQGIWDGVRGRGGRMRGTA